MCSCRLCGATCKYIFTQPVLGKYAVAYHRCESCRSLQTDTPFWLDEAYATGSLTLSDTGLALRGIDAQAIVWAAARTMRLPKAASVLDYGGGNGLLCRLLRDIGFQARVSDSYATNLFARSFDDDGNRPDILSAFEVAEHFANPATDMKSIFSRRASLMIIGTQTYRGQGADWWYLSPHSGQHVFFYSAAAMTMLAKLYDYSYTRIGSLHVFLDRPMSRVEAGILWRALSPAGLKWLRAYLAFRRTPDFASRDSARLAYQRTNFEPSNVADGALI